YSLIDQSLSARMSELTTNGDGFGLGWYGEHPEPGVFRTTQPAWNDLNLRDLAHQVRSNMFFAHIRAATGTLAVQQTNCHPFRFGRWLFQLKGLFRVFERLLLPLMIAVALEFLTILLRTHDRSDVYFPAL